MTAKKYYICGNVEHLKILVHRNATVVKKVISPAGEEVSLKNSCCAPALWELALRFPDDLIAWCEEKYLEHLDLDNWDGIFHHDLIMASYAIGSTFLPESIGYVDQMPFVRVNRHVLYGTWLMSSDVGAIKGHVLLRFRSLMGDIRSFDYLLNSVAKLGQQNSLFCYSAPGMVKQKPLNPPKYKASEEQLFAFIRQHYKSVWAVILLWSLYRYERKFSLQAFVKSKKRKKFFRKEVNLSDITISSASKDEAADTVDVIIPTMGRAEYLQDVVKDLSVQTHLPQKLIVIEQNPDENAASELEFLKDRKWPFEIVHHFIHRTGACNARNLALTEIGADWVFFADDDIRLQPELLKKVFAELGSLGADAINLNSKQKGETTFFSKVKQWGSFGSGTSIVKSRYAKQCRFSSVFEYGFGEDVDYGMQLRNLGCDIIYHPGLEIRHLKAPVGGFRQKPKLDWEQERPEPKPSPTLMAFVLRHYTEQQIKGFKTALFLRYYRKQAIKNPIAYIREMNKRWNKSKVWAALLLQRKN